MWQDFIRQDRQFYFCAAAKKGTQMRTEFNMLYS